MGIISKTVLFGFLPLDLLLHFIVGVTVTIFALKFNISYLLTTILLISIAFLKELNDYLFHITTTYTEYLSDFLITIVYVFLLGGVRLIKRKKILPEHKNKLDLFDRKFKKKD